MSQSTGGAEERRAMEKFMTDQNARLKTKLKSSSAMGDHMDMCASAASEVLDFLNSQGANGFASRHPQRR